MQFSANIDKTTHYNTHRVSSTAIEHNTDTNLQLKHKTICLVRFTNKGLLSFQIFLVPVNQKLVIHMTMCS